MDDQDELDDHQDEAKDGGVIVKTEPPDEDDGWIEQQRGDVHDRGIVLKIEPIDVAESSDDVRWEDVGNEAGIMEPEAGCGEVPTGGHGDVDGGTSTTRTPQMAMDADHLGDCCVDEGKSEGLSIGRVDAGDLLFAPRKQSLHVTHRNDSPEGPGNCGSYCSSEEMVDGGGWWPGSRKPSSQVTCPDASTGEGTGNWESESTYMNSVVGVESLSGSSEQDLHVTCHDDSSGEAIGNVGNKDMRSVPLLDENDSREVVGPHTDDEEGECSEMVITGEPHLRTPETNQEETKCSQPLKNDTVDICVSRPRFKTSRLEKVVKGLLRARGDGKSSQLKTSESLRNASTTEPNLPRTSPSRTWENSRMTVTVADDHGRKGIGTNIGGSSSRSVEKSSHLIKTPGRDCEFGNSEVPLQGDQDELENSNGGDTTLERISENIFDIISRSQKREMNFAIDDSSCTATKEFVPISDETRVGEMRPKNRYKVSGGRQNTETVHVISRRTGSIQQREMNFIIDKSRYTATKEFVPILDETRVGEMPPKKRYKVSGGRQNTETVHVISSRTGSIPLAEKTLITPSSDAGSNSPMVETLISSSSKTGSNSPLEETLITPSSIKSGSNPQATFQCTSCPKAYTTAANLKRHIKSHSGEKPYQCRYCGKSFTTVDKFKNHERIHTGDKRYQCQYCEKKFIFSDKCRSHERTHTGEKPFVCNFCDAAFTTRDKWRQHTKRKHAEEEGPYLCKFCNKGMKTKIDLVTHERGHTGYTPYQCTYCEVTCTSSSNLKRHIRNHTGERPYPCRFCDKAFTIKNYLTNHERIHLGERPHQCTHCGKGFVTSSALALHVRVHTGERPFQCQFCDKAFVRRDALKHHVGTHTGDRPFKCSMCDKAYTSSPHLRVHERTHARERPYKCTHCCKAFITSDKWRIHERIHTGVKPYQCTQCEEKFSSSTYLRRHEKSWHGGRKGGIGPADAQQVVVSLQSDVIEEEPMIKKDDAQIESDHTRQSISGVDGIVPKESHEPINATRQAVPNEDAIAFHEDDQQGSPTEQATTRSDRIVTREFDEHVKHNRRVISGTADSSPKDECVSTAQQLVLTEDDIVSEEFDEQVILTSGSDAPGDIVSAQKSGDEIMTKIRPLQE